MWVAQFYVLGSVWLQAVLTSFYSLLYYFVLSALNSELSGSIIVIIHNTRMLKSLWGSGLLTSLSSV